MMLSAPSESARLASDRVVLRPIGGGDYDFVFRLETAPENIDRWRFRGMMPSPEHFTRGLWDGVLAAFIVFDVGAKKSVGTVTLYNADLANGCVYLAAASLEEARHTGVMIEALGLLIEYGFATWSFRKVYVETLEFNFEQFRIVTKWLFEEEGRLREHEYHRGRYWDRIVLALTRERWDRYRHFLFDELVPPSHPDALGMDFDAFGAVLARELDLDPAAMATGARFSQDLGLDSMGCFALVTMLEWMTGRRLPPGLAGHLVTVDDAFAWYGSNHAR